MLLLQLTRMWAGLSMGSTSKRPVNERHFACDPDALTERVNDSVDHLQGVTTLPEVKHWGVTHQCSALKRPFGWEVKRLHNQNVVQMPSTEVLNLNLSVTMTNNLHAYMWHESVKLFSVHLESLHCKHRWISIHIGHVNSWPRHRHAH